MKIDGTLHTIIDGEAIVTTDDGVEGYFPAIWMQGIEPHGRFTLTIEPRIPNVLTDEDLNRICLETELLLGVDDL